MPPSPPNDHQQPVHRLSTPHHQVRLTYRLTLHVQMVYIMRMTYYVIDDDDDQTIITLEAKTLDEAIEEAGNLDNINAQIVDVYQVGRTDPVAESIDVAP